MRLENITCQEIKTDVLVIGSEAAGGKAAIEAQEEGADVLVVTKGLIGKSGDTVMAGWGIQAALGHIDPRDNPDVFLEDVVKGGGYLNNQKLVERLVNLSLTEVPKMEKWGAKFMKTDGKFIQYELPGSSYPRTLHPISYHGGLQWVKAFKSQFKRLNTKIIEDTFVISLLLSDGQVAGALAISLRDGQFIIFRSKVTVLATGGCPQIYRMTDSNRDATGDGIALAYNAGAELMDMEFQQFFPLCCYTPPFEMDMLTANLRYGLRAKFYNSLGEPFLERYLPLTKEWGLRDPTSRAIWLENKYGRGSPHGGAYIAVNHLPENLINDWIQREKPAYLPKLKKAGIDIFKHALECGPACHYSMGGVVVNENCETTLPRLYAAGEVAAGMDGAERIDGGPAITWCLTMGYIAGKEAAKAAKELDWLDAEPGQVKEEQSRVNSLLKQRKGVKGLEVIDKLKNTMWETCSLVKDKAGMEDGLSLIQKLKSDDLPRLCVPSPSRVLNRGLEEALEATNMVLLSEMVIRASSMREESRKAHTRTDFPKLDNKNWLQNIIINKKKEKMVFTTRPPVITKIKPTEKKEIEE
ncbi:MAG: FAD-binding protein [Dehalococcoidia bacterium]|nr:FAD-binding protein [Dehalococcoidia bacterium]